MIGQQIREERENQNISLKQLALEVGVTPSALSQIERGKRSLRIKLLLKITDALHITPNDILGRNKAVSASDIPYIVYLSKKDIEILKEIKKHNALYKSLCSKRGKAIIEKWAKRNNI